MDEFLKSINKGNSFAPCNPSDFLTVEAERKRSERKIREERRKRREQIEMENEEKRRQEEEDFLFAQQEQLRLNGTLEHNGEPYRPGSAGRGKRIDEFMGSSPKTSPSGKGRGRGRFTNDNSVHTLIDNLDIEPLNLFKREENIRNQIDKLGIGEKTYNNNRIVPFWQGIEAPTIEIPRMQDSPHSDCSSNLQFEDAQCSPSPLSWPSEILSFQSVSSSSSSSPVIPPVPEETSKNLWPPEAPPEEAPRKELRPRLAAKFPSAVESGFTSGQKENGLQQNCFAVLSPSAHPEVYPRARGAQGGPSINSINPSQRLMLLKPEDFLTNSNLNYGSNTGFYLNKEEFPPLSNKN